MSEPRVPLYQRLPEIYRIRDAEPLQAGQLKAYLAPVEDAFSAVHENIESLYHDLFIEFCDDWVIPYLGDLLGTTHLSGDPWTLRADVADTIALRRRKGTLGAIELLTYNLTRWGVHCVELRENLGWNQHLNHQRPDAGGAPPYGRPGITRNTPRRGGTVPLRDPALLSLLATPFDPFAYTADAKAAVVGSIRYNLPNLAIFLWRLQAYRIEVSRPVFRAIQAKAAPPPPEAAFVARIDVHPTGEPVRLFNTYRFDPDRRPPVLTEVDEVPGPMPTARLTQGSDAGNPAEYVAVETYDATDPTLATVDISPVGLQLHLPDAVFAGNVWTIRGANLCAWEDGLRPPLNDREIAIDPVIGRIAIGLNTAAEGTAVVNDLLLTFTYGAVGPVGAHPISRPAPPAEWIGEAVTLRTVNFNLNSNGLRLALDNIENFPAPMVIEIQDSMTHTLNIDAVAGAINEAGGFNLRLNRSLIIRAASGQRPVVKLVKPLRFRPTNVLGANPAQQQQFDAINANITVRLEGLYLTRDDAFPGGAPLIARAAINSLELVGCTLDPGGFIRLDGTRAPIRAATALAAPYGFSPAEELAFKETPEVHVQRTIAGPILVDSDYTLFVADSIVDAGAGVGENASAALAVSSATNPANAWGPPTQVSSVTIFGRMRVETIEGRGGIWVHTLEARNNQKGCVKFSFFSGEGDRLPQNFACVTGPGVRLHFTAEAFGQPGYGQIAAADFRIRERGPGDDAMGAFGFLLEAHKWRNLQIRYREFMPVGVRPLLIPVT